MNKPTIYVVRNGVVTEAPLDAEVKNAYQLKYVPGLTTNVGWKDRQMKVHYGAPEFYRERSFKNQKLAAHRYALEQIEGQIGFLNERVAELEQQRAQVMNVIACMAGTEEEPQHYTVKAITLRAECLTVDEAELWFIIMARRRPINGDSITIATDDGGQFSCRYDGAWWSEFDAACEPTAAPAEINLNKE